MYMQNANGKLEGDDLDLFSLLTKGKNLLKKYKGVIITIYVIGLAIGAIYYFTKPKVYQSSLIASSNVIKGSSFIMVLEGLQRHLSEGNYGPVAKHLNVDEEFVKKIKKLEVFSARNFSKKQLSDKITEEFTTTDLVVNDYIIEAYVSDNTIWPQLEKSLLYYLNNNDFSKLKNSEKKESLKRVRDKIESQLGRIDSLALNITEMYSRNKGSNSTNMLVTDPSSVYNNIIGLYQTQIETERELKEPEIYVIQGFIPYKKQYSPRAFATALMSIVLSTLFAAAFIIYKEN